MAIANAWPHGDPSTIARSIVAQARYRSVSRAPVAHDSWLDLLWTWFVGLMRGLLRGLDRALGSNTSFGTQIGFVVITVGLGCLAWGVYVLVGSYVRGSSGRRVAEQRLGSAASAQSSASLRTAARAAAQAGRFREAAALLFMAASRALDERGRVAYDAARTPGEYRRLIRDPLFDILAGAAVIALFAAAEPPSELFEQMSATYERFFDGPVR